MYVFYMCRYRPSMCETQKLSRAPSNLIKCFTDEKLYYNKKELMLVFKLIYFKLLYFYFT